MLNKNKHAVFQPGDLLLIETHQEEATTNFIKLALGLIKEFGHRPPYQFVSVEGSAQLIDSLTLKQNLGLSLSSLVSGPQNDDEKIAKWLKQFTNPHIHQFLEIITDWDSIPSQTSLEQVKALCLTKALLGEAPYLLFDQPELDLSQEALELFAKALNFELIHQRKMAMLRSEKMLFWRPKGTKWLQFHQHDYEIHPLIQEKIRAKFMRDERPPLASDQELVFHWPTELTKKSA